jgi:hypothetical protein
MQFMVRRESPKFEDADEYPEDMNKMPKVSSPPVSEAIYN